MDEETAVDGIYLECPLIGGETVLILMLKVHRISQAV